LIPPQHSHNQTHPFSSRFSSQQQHGSSSNNNNSTRYLLGPAARVLRPGPAQGAAGPVRGGGGAARGRGRVGEVCEGG